MLSTKQITTYNEVFSNMSEHFNYCDHLSNESTAEEVMSSLLDYAIPQESEFIYTDVAENYIITESSIEEALELASELGYTITEVTTGLLALLVKQQILTNELFHNEEAIIAFFEER